MDLYHILDRKAAKTPPSTEVPKLEIKLDERKIVTIKNAVVKYAESPEELMALFTTGNLERHVGATKMNAESSRSHSIFTIMVRVHE